MSTPWTATPRPTRSWLHLTIFGALILLAFWGSGGASGETGEELPGQTSLSTKPVHVSVQGADKLREFIAGETGELDLGLILSTKTDGAGRSVAFRTNDAPATVRLSAPKDSGIRFGDKSPGDQIVVPVVIDDPSAEVISVKVPYAVSSRVRVRKYALKLDISVPLSASDGGRIQDAGTIDLPGRVDTPLNTKLLVLLVLAVAVLLFVLEWVRVDVVAICMMISLPMLNLLESGSTFTGLSSNAVVAIIGVMIISAGLNRVGLVSRAVKPVIDKAGKSATRLTVFLSSLIAAISSVMQNTGAAVLFLPGIRHACKVMRIPVAKVLMPIGMCAILGGTMTMIGTSPLILLNDILPEGVEKFGLLELAPIGLGFVVSGILYFTIVGRVFLDKIAKDQGERAGKPQEEEVETFSLYHRLDGPFELHVPDDFKSKGEPVTMVGIRRTHHVNIVCLADDAGLHELAPAPDAEIGAGLSLCAYGPEDSVRLFAKKYGIVILDQPSRFKDLFNRAVAGTVEAAVSPRSQLIGETIRDISFRRTFGVTVLAVFRGGRTYYKELADIPLASGDALLLHSTWEHFASLQHAHMNFQIITPLDVDVQKPAKAKSAVISFGIALTLMLVSSFYFQKLPYNPIPLSVCLMTGALLMVVLRVVSIQDAYHAVDWRTVFLLGGLIPLGMAVDRTGTAEWIARGVIIALGDSVTPLVLIIILAFLSGAFCLVISNVGACTLLVPLGASMAAQIGVDPRVAAIVVGLGVSNSFLLPTHQVNALYMGPGGYRTKDYLKIGGVMSLIYIAVLVSMTYFFYL